MTRDSVGESGVWLGDLRDLRLWAGEEFSEGDLALAQIVGLQEAWSAIFREKVPEIKDTQE